MNRVQIKETAKNLLKKNHWLCVGAGLIVSFLGYISIDLSSSGNSYSKLLGNSGLSDILNGDLHEIFSEFSTTTANTDPLTELLLMIISIVISVVLTVFVGNQILVGARRFFLKYRKNHPVEIGEIFKSYTDKTYLNVAKVTFIKDISIFGWTLLCIVPGVIKSYEYAAVEYILAVNPTMEYSKALNLSSRIMNGHKLELFELHISFIGWQILSLFTCNLLSFLYVQPYMLITDAEFFAYVRELAIFNGVISYNDIPDYEQYNPQPPMYQGFAPNGYYYNQPCASVYTPPQPAEPVFTPAEAMDKTTAEIVDENPIEESAASDNDTSNVAANIQEPDTTPTDTDNQ